MREYSDAPTGTLRAIRGSLASLRVRPFGRLLTTYTLNYLGDHAALVALAVLVYGETGDAVATSALFIASQFFPAFLAPALTARVDQLSLRGLLPLIYAAEGLIFAALALIADDFVLWIVLVLVVVDGVLMLTARALTRSAVNATLTPRGLLREGNGLLNIGFAVAGVGGAALGGLLVDAYGVSTALALDAGSFFLIALLLVTTRHLPGTTAEREPLRARMRSGFKYARDNRWIRLLLGGEGLAIVFFALIVPIEVIYAKETLKTDDAGFGLLLSSWGAGIVLGSLTYVAVKNRRSGSLILMSTTLIGLAYLGMSAVDRLWLACAFSVLGGLGNGIQWIAVVTAVQEATPNDLQARITGLLESISSIGTGIGFLLGGILTAVLSPPTTFAIAGAGTLVLAVGALALRPDAPPAPPPEVRAAPAGPAPPVPSGSNTLTFAGTAILVAAAVASALRRR